MNFRTKDLMVTVVPKGDLQAQAACRFPTLTACRCTALQTIGCGHFCTFVPSFQCRFGCSFQITEVPTLCRLGTIDLGPINCTGTIRCAGSMTPELEGPPQLEDIGALREQLQAQLKALDEAEAAQTAGPATIAEAETLEAHLKDALAQVQARKAELKGGKK